MKKNLLNTAYGINADITKKQYKFTVIAFLKRLLIEIIIDTIYSNYLWVLDASIKFMVFR